MNAEEKALTKGLTSKQVAYCQEYLVDLNGKEAAIRAGYSEHTATAISTNNLAKPHVNDYLVFLKSQRTEETGIDAKYVLTQAKKLHERCMQEIEPVTDKNGVQLKTEDGRPIFTFNAQGAAKGLELVGKHIDVQAFKDKIEVEMNQDLVSRITQGRNRTKKK